MQARARDNPKVEFRLGAEVVAAHGDGSTLQSLSIRSSDTGDVAEVPAGGLFFAIGHEPATGFLGCPPHPRPPFTALP